MKDIEKIVEESRTYYPERVKPLMDEGLYLLASLEMSNLLDGFLMLNAEKIALSVHMGIGYITWAKLLQKKLYEAEEKPESAIRHFEAYSAQTKLPKS